MTRVLGYKTQFFFFGTVISYMISCATLKTPFDLRGRCSPCCFPLPLIPGIDWNQLPPVPTSHMWWNGFSDYSHINQSIASGSWSDPAVECMHLLFNIKDLTVTTEYFSKFIISHSYRCIINYDLNHSCFWAVLKFDVSIEDVQPLHGDFVLYWFIFEG